MKRKYNWQIPILLIAGLLLTGCFQGQPSKKPPIHLNPNMDHQQKVKAQAESNFFENGSGMRPPVEGTVAQGYLRENTVYYSGKDESGKLVAKMPVTITANLLQRGRERYTIFCQPCHDGVGNGKGIVVKKGFMPPPSFHLDRLRNAPDGHFFDVITNGIRNMPTYRHQVPVEDRWAIVAYIRALQRSQSATIDDVPQDKRNELN